jgi:opacity protein-like surface antigen
MSDKAVYPYLGAGIGWSDVYADFSDNTKNVRSTTLFTYAFSTGLVYNLNEYIDFDLGYRYTKIADKDLKIAGTASTFTEYANELFLAGKYKF